MEDTESLSQLSPLDKNIRKIRKKLRQIEALQLLDRDLNDEERIKVKGKYGLRKELRCLLEQVPPEDDDDDIMKRQSLCEGDSNIATKKAKSTENVQSKDLNSGNTLPAGNLETSPVPDKRDATEKKCAQENIGIKASETKNNSSSTSRKEDPKQVNLKEAKQESSLWKDNSYEVFDLEGHNDIILSVDCNDEYIISASRDTTVKVWRVFETKEERSLRGHTASVTAVAFLPVELACSVLKKFEDDPDSFDSVYSKVSPDRRVLAASGSLDCSLRVWDITTGESFGSIYTYNGISVMQCGKWGAVTGTEGGKLEFWCITTGNRHAFVNAFQCQVTALYIENNHRIYAGSAEGDVGIWQYSASSRSVSSVFIMESESHAYVPLKSLAALVGVGGVLYLGDSGPNIKVLDWKKGSITRLRNHKGDIGMTDSLAIAADGHLLASSYCIDTGRSSINVREAGTGKYVCSLVDTDEGRYLAMSCSPGIIVTAGHLLKVWVQGEKRNGQKKIKSPGKVIVTPKFYHKFSIKAAESASEDNTDWASSSDEENDYEEDSSGDISHGPHDPVSSWWCSIL